MTVLTFEIVLKQRITIAEVIENEWFKKGYQPPVFEQEEVNLDDVNAIFNESAVCVLIFSQLFCFLEFGLPTILLCGLYTYICVCVCVFT